MKHLGCILAIVFFASLSVGAYLHPLPMADGLYYVGAVLTPEFPDAANLRVAVLADSATSEKGPRTVAYDSFPGPEYYVESLSFYAIRPLYILAARALHRLGLSATDSLKLISVASFFGIGLVVLFWTQRPLLASLIVFTPPVIELARYVLPDAFSTVAVLLAIWAFVKNRWGLASVFLLVSIWIRSDNAILACCIFALMFVLGERKAALFVLVAGASFWAINHFGGYPGWSVLFHHSFTERISAPGEAVVSVSAREYLRGLFIGLRGLGTYGFLPITALVAAITWTKLAKGSPYRLLFPACGLAITARFLLFPMTDNRYYTWAYLMVAVVVAELVFSQRALAGRQSDPDCSNAD